MAALCLGDGRQSFNFLDWHGAGASGTQCTIPIPITCDADREGALLVSSGPLELGRVAVFSRALIMVGQNFNNAAVADATVITFIDHALQFMTQGLQLLDATFNLYQMTARDTVGLMTGILWPFRHGK